MTTSRRSIFTATGCAAAALAACGKGAPKPADPETVEAAKVPVGGGIVLANHVVTQPVEGEFYAFSNVCPHAYCRVNKVPADGIFCGCHGSVFKITDGSVLRGPSKEGLAAVPVRLTDTTLTVG